MDVDWRGEASGAKRPTRRLLQGKETVAGRDPSSQIGEILRSVHDKLQRCRLEGKGGNKGSRMSLRVLAD